MARSIGFKVAIGSGILVVLLVVVGVVVLVIGSSASCACSIPPNEEDAIATAQEYVAGVDEAPEAMLAEDAQAPTAEQVSQLSLLDHPDTTWTVLVTERPDGGYGRSPAERLVVGIAPEGEVAALVVHTETDYEQGTVDPAVEARETEPVIARSGQYPIFGELNVGMSDDARGRLAVVPLAGDPIALSVTGNGGAWAYVGAEPLQEEEYRYVRGGQRSSDDAWWFGAAWFSPSDPVTEDD
ncbi:hypothetical protein [Ruania zhangjianzhongii]|uniref:hypothetical protein n=1 Tax=Ruania zhangjianzhongii TaxID=2603206 RepID=UPI0011C74A99|nr:hypothetical protein [Ruania zhangjianzhongii]